MNRSHFSFFGFCAALVSTLALGCAQDTQSPGGLMLVTSTDLQIPKDVSKVGVQVIDGNGVERHAKWYTLGPSPDKTELPATLAIEPGKTDDPIQIRLFAQRGDGKVITLSEATTTVPRSRVAMLRMPIEWLSVGMVKPAEQAPVVDAGDPLFPNESTFRSNVTTCPQGMTPRGGTCVSTQVDSASLPTYTPGQVNGGGNGSGNGTCFDTVGCFANSVPLIITDRQNCVINANSLGAVAAATGVNAIGRLSLGLVPADGSGICGSNGCIVTLDFIGPGASGSGWSIQNGSEIRLPAAVCEKLTNGTLRAVVAATGCDSKTPEVPNCGPWSSVDSATASKPIESDLLSLCWQFAERACEGIGRCRGGTQFVDGAEEDDGTCTERMHFLCDASLVEPAAEPWRKYFTECGAAFSEPSCSQLELKVRTACVEPSTAAGKADGSACSFGQCGSASTCFGAVPNGVGQCTPRFDTGKPLCGTNSVIDALLPQGACVSGLICEHATQTCRKPGALDETCSDDSNCQADLVCAKGKCTTPVATGGTCGDDRECAAGLHCVVADNKQQCRGPGQAGESCRVVATDQQSAIWQENLCDLSKGLRCDPETGVCGVSRLVKQGSACTTLNSCAGGYCSGKLSGEPTSSGTCLGYRADGASCENTAQCGPPAECLDKVCRLRPVFGCTATTMQAVPGSSPLCSNGKPACSTGCVDLDSDSNNCGQCNLKCPSGAECVSGACACGAQQLLCDRVCTSVQTDPNHCGDCNVKCSSGQTCSLGMCTGCSSGLNLCDTSCVNFLNDASHCGDCTTACAKDATCVSGKCQVMSGAGGATSIGGSAATAAGATSIGGSAAVAGGSAVTGSSGGSKTNPNTGEGGSSSVGGYTSSGGTSAVVDTSASGGSEIGATTQVTGGSGPLDTTLVAVGGYVSPFTTGGSSASTTDPSVGGSGGSASSAGGASGTTTSIDVGGTAATGGTSSVAYAECPTVSGSTGGTSASIPPLVITGEGENVYVTSGDGLWYGYLMLEVDSAGSVISAPVPTLTTDLTMGYCTSGSVVPGDLETSPVYAGFGFYLQQNSNTREVLTVSPSSAGVNVNVVNNAGSPLFVQILGSSATGAPATWCAPISGRGGYIPWTSFNTKCWDGSGLPYRYEPVQSVAIIAAPKSVTASTDFDYCLVNIGESGSRSEELVNADGWVGGDAGLITDDPAGIQGSFWAAGDGVAYTPPKGNPCTADGCCIKGSTIVDPSYAAWGGEVGLGLGYFPNAQAEGVVSVCPYRGNSDCFDAILTGDTGGNVLHWGARTSQGLLPSGSSYPSIDVPAFSNGWSGRVCLADFRCAEGTTGCSLTGQWFALWAQVQGNERNSTFSVCLKSLKAVKND